MTGQGEPRKHSSQEHRTRDKSLRQNATASSSKNLATLPRIPEEITRSNSKEGSSSKKPENTVSTPKKRHPTGPHPKDRQSSPSPDRRTRQEAAVLSTLWNPDKTRIPTSKSRTNPSASKSNAGTSTGKHHSNVALPTDEWIWNENVLGHLIQETDSEWQTFYRLEAQFKAQYKALSSEERDRIVSANRFRHSALFDVYEKYINCSGCPTPSKADQRNLYHLLESQHYGKNETGGRLLIVMKNLKEMEIWMKRFQRDKKLMEKNGDKVPRYDKGDLKKLWRFMKGKGEHLHEAVEKKFRKEDVPSDIELDVLRKDGKRV